MSGARPSSSNVVIFRTDDRRVARIRWLRGRDAGAVTLHPGLKRFTSNHGPFSTDSPGPAARSAAPPPPGDPRHRPRRPIRGTAPQLAKWPLPDRRWSEPGLTPTILTTDFAAGGRWDVLGCR